MIQFYPKDERKGYDGPVDGPELIYDATVQDLLLPGSDSESVKCNIRDSEGNESDVDHVLEDPYKLNCLFPGEIAQVKFDPQSGALIPNGSSGLLRRVSVLSDISENESGACNLISDDENGETTVVGEIEVFAEFGLSEGDTIWVQFRRDLGAQKENDNGTTPAALGKWVPIKGTSGALNIIRGYCLSNVSVDDAEFRITVTESYPGKIEGEWTVVNPLDSVGSNKHGYTLKQNDYVTCTSWLDEKLLCIDGPCNANNEQANTPPTDITLSSSSVDEESPGQIVGTLTVVDADLPNDNHTLEIIGTDNGLELAGTTLKVKDDVELESGDSPIIVSIQATDAGGLIYEKDFSITINSITSLGRFALDNIDLVLASSPSAPSKDHSDYNADSIPNNIIWDIQNYTVSAAGTDTIVFTVRNTGSATLNVSNISLQSNGNLFDSIDKTTMSIAAGGTDTVTLTLFGSPAPVPAPATGANYEGVITFTHDGDSFGESTPWLITLRMEVT